MFVYKKLDEADEHFDPGASINKINFYNTFTLWEKMNKKQKGKKIIYVNSF